MTKDEKQKKLLQVVTMYQFYIEQRKYTDYVKNAEFMKLLRRTFKEVLLDTDFTTFDGLSQQRFYLFLRKLRDMQIAHWDTFTQQLLNELNGFDKADRNALSLFTRRASQSFVLPRKEEGAILAPLSMLVPAFGQSAEAQLVTVRDNLFGNMVKAIQRAYVEKQPILTILGLVSAGKVLTEQKLNAFTATTTQHISTQNQLRSFRTISDEYYWASIIDAVTSAICRSRNGNIYVWGHGPLPPAHDHCRSQVIPLIRGATPANMKFSEWLDSLPDNWRARVGKQDAGTFTVHGGLTNDEFGNRIDELNFN